MLSTEFILTSLVVVLIPGTGVLYTVSMGLIAGGRASVAAALGCTVGIVPHLLASILGLSAIMHISSVAFQCVKMAGAVYLLYLAWSMWRETGGLAFSGSNGDKRFWRIALRGVWVNLLNPKLSIFFLAFLPLFVSPEAASPMLQMLTLSGVFMVMTLLIFICYGISAHGVRKHVINSPRVMTSLQKSFAVVFAALGAKLALTEQ